MGCSVPFELASVPQRTCWLGGFWRPRGAPRRVPNWSFTAPDSRSSQPRRVTVAGGEPSESTARVRFGRADGVSELRLGCRSQQAASGPEKPPGCVPGGGRGSSSPAGNRAGAKRRRAPAVPEAARNGPVKGHLLAEGALGRRSRHSSRGGGGSGLGLAGRSVFASGSSGVTRASERGGALMEDGEQPSFVRGDAEQSGPRGVNSSILRRATRRAPSGARVLVFEMWIAEAGQTHLWSAT